MIQGGGLAAVAITFSQYLLRLSGAGTADPRPFAILALILVALVNYAGVKPGSRLLNVLVALKIGGARRPDRGRPVARALAAPRGARSRRQRAPPRRCSPSAAALVPILFSYGGWQNANVLAEEIREPRRTLPRALVAGTLIVIAVYVLVNVVYLATLGRDGLAATADARRRRGPAPLRRRAPSAGSRRRSRSRRSASWT